MIQQKLQLKLQQKLSPLQIQTIKLLEIPTIELEDRIKEELESNPALEEGEELSKEESISKLKEEEDYNTDENLDYSLDDYRTEDDIPDYKLFQPNGNSDEAKEEAVLESSTSLHDYLKDQINLQPLPENIRILAEYVIGNIDQDGYLRRSVESMVDDYSFQSGTIVSDDDMKEALKFVQSFEPAGIAATNLQECLVMQLERKAPTDSIQNAIKILTSDFDDFSQRRFKQIEAKTGLSQDEIKKASQEIIKLNPKPGNAWESGIPASSLQISPDFQLDNEDGNLILTLNDINLPPLRINREFAEMLDDYSNAKQKSREKKDAILFVKQKLDAAKWFIDSVKQRQETLRNTLTAIINIQHDFFIDGDDTKLKPLILKDISNITGYDVSTISRACNNKYIQTEFGIFPVSYFFSGSLQTNDGEEVSINEIKATLQELLDHEDKRSPLTDDKITEMLKEKGYSIARRTVAKYREQLGYQPARLRKEIV